MSDEPAVARNSALHFSRWLEVSADASYDGSSGVDRVDLAMHDLVDGSVLRAAMKLPRQELSLTGLSAALARDDEAGVADAAEEYGAVLRRTIDAALQDLPSQVVGSRRALGTSNSPILVSVQGPPRIHQILWEALDSLPGSGDEGATLVAHLSESAPVVEFDATARHGVGPSVLRWVGARPFAKDLPRYLIAGPVASHLLGKESVRAKALHLEVVRTNASRQEAHLLLSARGKGPLVLHLDVHGTSRMRPAKEFGFIAEPEFTAAFRGADSKPITVSEQSILDDVVEAGAHMFVTNSCFGAQQRDVNQWSMPARLIGRGCRVAIAARDPLDGVGAMLFFSSFYGALGTGATVGAAFADARAFLMQHPAGSESGWGTISARYGLQPVLWVQALSELCTYFGPPDSDQPADVPEASASEDIDQILKARSNLCDYVELARVSEGFARVMESIEDKIWEGWEPESIVGSIGRDKLADLSSSDTTELLRQACELVGGNRIARWVPNLRDPPMNRVVADADVEQGATLPFPRFSVLERLLLVTMRFAGQSNPLRELLVHATPGDVRQLDYLVDTTDRDLAKALLLALSWSDSNAALVELSSDVEAVFDELSIECDQFVDENELGAGAGTLLLHAHQVDWALPLVALQPQFVETLGPMPLKIPRPVVDQLLANKSIGLIKANKSEVAVLLSRRDQIALRRRLEPLEVVRADQFCRRSFEATAKPLTPDTRWNAGTKLVSAAWLSLAIAYRQVGVAHPLALKTALSILNLVDRGAALLVLDALIEGLPAWQPLAEPEVVEFYRGQRTFWDGLHNRYDDSHELDAVKETPDYALALLHARRFLDALAVTSRIVERFSDANGNLTDAIPADVGFSITDVRNRHAYALTRNGRVGEALAFAAPDIRNIHRMSLFDQCELLHLLGDLMEAADKPAAAVAYMLQERTRRSPALHRRLHNRAHLLDLLSSTGADADFRAVIACEGLNFAIAAGSSEEIDNFSAALTELAVGLPEQGRASAAAALNAIDSPSLTVQVARIIVSRDPDDPVAEGETATLYRYVATGDRLSSLICYYLANQPSLTPSARVEVLKQGAMKSRGYGLLCLVELVDALLAAEDWDQLADYAERLLEAVPASGLALAARGAVHLAGGDRLLAIEAMARGFCYEHVLDLARKRLGFRQFWTSHEDLVREAGSRSVELLVEQSNQLEAGTPSERAVLPGLDLNDVIDRVYELNRHTPEVDPEVVRTLVDMSESAWDRADYLSAINARSRACQLLEMSGDRINLATELGWLATLVKQSGNASEAMSLYQRALTVGDGVLDTVESSSLVGRYANLLHQNGDFEAAAIAQWRAVSVAIGAHSMTDLVPFPPSNNLLASRLGYLQLAEPHLARWPLLLVNLANCLNAAGYLELSRIALRACNVVSVATRDRRAPVNTRDIARLYPVVHRSLRSKGLDLADVPEIFDE